MAGKTHKDLDVWKVAKQLAVEVYRMSRQLPVQERYGLVGQMTRAAVSIPSNIAEGAARANTREFSQFISIALSSGAELETQLIIAEEAGLLSPDDIRQSKELVERVNRMLTALRHALQAKTANISGSRIANRGSRL